MSWFPAFVTEGRFLWAGGASVSEFLTRSALSLHSNQNALRALGLRERQDYSFDCLEGFCVRVPVFDPGYFSYSTFSPYCLCTNYALVQSFLWWSSLSQTVTPSLRCFSSPPAKAALYVRSLTSSIMNLRSSISVLDYLRAQFSCTFPSLFIFTFIKSSSLTALINTTVCLCSVSSIFYPPQESTFPSTLHFTLPVDISNFSSVYLTAGFSRLDVHTSL